MATYIGTAGNDTYTGTAQADSVSGNAGNDNLRGEGGNDSLDGGAGNDLLHGGADEDTLIGGGGNDTLDGGAMTDRHDFRDANTADYSASTGPVAIDLTGLTGDGRSGSGTAQDGVGGTDTLRNLQIFIGTDFADRFVGSNALQFEMFLGGAGDDTIDGGTLSDPLNRNLNGAGYNFAPSPVSVDLAAGTASGGAGNDRLSNINVVGGSHWADVLRGSDRSDVFEVFFGNGGDDTIDGRGGFDYLNFGDEAVSTGVDVNLQTGVVHDGLGGTDSVSGIEGVAGSVLADRITGSDNPDLVESFIGKAGNDTISGGGGIDWVGYEYTAAGVNVTLPGTGTSSASDGERGTDVLSGIEAVRGSPFADTLTGSDELDETLEGYAGNDTLDGRGGRDSASYENSWNTGAVVDLWLGSASNDGWGTSDLLIGIENVTGTLLYGDRITGSNHDNSLFGLGGNDTLIGLAGDDSFDTGTGIDSVDGGEGYDELWVPYPYARFTVSRVSPGVVRLVSTLDGVDISFRDVEVVYFSNRTETPGTLIGGGQPTEFADALSDGPGNETVDALAGNDNIISFGGNDSLIGGAGDDLFQPEEGSDSLDGGSGYDSLRLFGNRADYTLGSAAGFELQLTRISSGQQVAMRGVEKVMFADTASFVGALLAGNNVATAFADSLGGGAGADNIDALAGDDSVDAGAGDDTLIGGAGDDTLVGNSGIDTVTYAQATAGVVASLLTGSVSGGAGNDRLFTIEHLLGSPFDDSLSGDGGDNRIDGGAGNDTLWGGGSGNDTFIGGPGNDRFHGGVDTNTVSYASSPAGVIVNLPAGHGLLGSASDGFGGSDSFVEGTADILIGSEFADSLTGSDSFLTDGGDDLGADTIYGLAGNDTLRGLEGRDYLDGGSGNDLIVGGGAPDDGQDIETLIGGPGNDTIDGSSGFAAALYRSSPAGITVNLSTGVASDGWGGTDTLLNVIFVVGSDFADSLTGDDAFNAFAGYGGDDTIDGRGGIDWVIYDEASGPVTIDLANGTASGGGLGNDTLLNIECAVGTSFADRLVGSDAANELEGDPGNDSLIGAGGDDTLTGGDGADSLDGGPGSDWASYREDKQGASVNLATGANNRSDTLISIENLIGSAFNDGLTGDNGANQIDGKAGNDDLRGGGGNDTLIGGAGADALRGQQGNDLIDGGVVLDRTNYSDRNLVLYNEDPAAVSVDLSGITGDGSSGSGTARDGFGDTDTLVNISFVSGSSFNDDVLGSTALVFEHFEGRGGNDTIDGGAITDPIFNRNANRANYGNAPLAVMVDLAAGRATGGDGGDRLININSIRASQFNDTLFGSDTSFNSEQFEPQGGADTIDGRGGTDVVRYDGATAPVIASLVAGIVSQDGYGYTDVLFSIEGLRGGQADDQLTGGNPANGTTALPTRADNGFERFEGGAGNDTLDGGIGFDLAIYINSTGPVDVHLGGTADGSASDGVGGSDVLRSIEAVWGSQFADRLAGSARADYEVFNGRKGNDTIDGGDVNRASDPEFAQIDVADYRTDEVQGIVADLRSGTVIDGFGDTDTLSGVEAIFGSFFADSLRGADQAENIRGETLRGGDGNDTLDGGGGVDSAEFRGNRADYTLTSISGGRWSLRDNDSVAGGNDGTDTLADIERLVFNDQMIAFGSRAEEIARVAFVLWTKDIVGSGALFSRGLSFYDVGYDFATMSVVALQFWTADSDTQLAQRLITNSGSTKTVAQLLRTMAANGGSVEGRAAALREIALDPATTLLIEQSHIREVGLVASNSVPGFGTLFDLLGG